MYHLSRRQLLKLLGMGLAGASLPVLADTTRPSPQLAQLQKRIFDAIGPREIGLDLRKIDPVDGYEFFHIQHRSFKLYPVASCFKTWVALYYFLFTPKEEWDVSEESPVYRMIVVSDNYMTGVVIDEVGQRRNMYGNALQKFNDFVVYTMGLQNGIHKWDWDSPTGGLTDDRFEPSFRRFVSIDSTHYSMDNVTSATDLADGYLRLFNPTFNMTLLPDPVEAIEQTIALLSIGIQTYRSPIERAFGDYIGKDGTLPPADSVVGSVINDAGIIKIDQSTYIMSYLCVDVGEFNSVHILSQIAEYVHDYEALLNNSGL